MRSRPGGHAPRSTARCSTRNAHGREYQSSTREAHRPGVTPPPSAGTHVMHRLVAVTKTARRCVGVWKRFL